MKKIFLNRYILCGLIIVFMYIAAACSVSNDTKKMNQSNKISDADKSAFAGVANSIINSAQQKYVVDSIESGVAANCYTLKDLDEYIEFDLNKYEGVVINTESNGWEVYLTDGKLTVNGGYVPVNKNSVMQNDTLRVSKCN